MPRRASLLWGLVMPGLLIVEIVTKVRRHPENRRQGSGGRSQESGVSSQESVVRRFGGDTVEALQT